MQSEIDLATLPGRDKNGFDPVDLFAGAIERQAQAVIVFAKIRIGRNRQPASRIDMAPLVLGYADGIRHRIGLPRPGLEHGENASRQCGEVLRACLCCRLDQQG
ncbi:hypothetical protein D3C86_1967370 [compost metagenome]